MISSAPIASNAISTADSTVLVSHDLSANYSIGVSTLVRNDLQASYVIGSNVIVVPRSRTVVFAAVGGQSVRFAGGSRTVVFPAASAKTVVFSANPSNITT